MTRSRGGGADARVAWRRRFGVGAAILLSLAAHVALLAASLAWRRPAPPEPAVLELEVLDLGDAPEEVAPELPPSEVVAPRAPSVAPVRRPRTPAAPEVAPVDAGEALPVAETGAEPAGVPAVEAPPSFRAWQAQRVPYADVGASDAAAEIASGGAQQGVRRCEPPAGRRYEVLYLLIDSSGSMSRTSGPNAMTCAHQVAKAAIDAGASVVVGNFARETTFSGPTRSMLDVEVAIRAPSDGTATILPSRELQPYIDAHPDADAELVIVSDGIFVDDGRTLPWYRYFLELNPENRGRMYTVGGAGERESVKAIRGVGFDVFMYDPLRVQ